MIDDIIRERLSQAIQQLAQDSLDEAMKMEPIITGGSISDLYAEYVAYEWPRRHREDEANVVEGSIVEPITEEGRLLE